MSRPTASLVLLGILAVAALVRVAGVDYLLPLLRENDAHIVEQAEILAGVERLPSLGTEEIQIAKYPHLLPWMLVPINASEPIGDLAAGTEVAAHLEAASRPMLRARLLVLVLSVLLIPGTYLLTRLLAGRYPGLLAAALVAVSLLHTVVSQQARPHGPFATFAVFAVILAIHVRRGVGPLGYLGAGAAAAAALGTLHFGVFALPPLLIAFLLEPDGGRRGRRRRRWWHAGLTLLPIVVAAPLFYPFVFAGGGAEQVHELGSHQFGSFQWTLAKLSQAHMHLVRNDPALIWLALLGGAVYVVRAWRAGGPTRVVTGISDDAWVAASFVLPFYFVVCGIMNEQYRFMIALLPFLAGLGAYGVTHLLGALTGWIPNVALRRTVVALGFAAVLAAPTHAVLRLAALHRDKDTLTLAAEWIERNADRDDTILLQAGLTLPLFSRPGNVTNRELAKGFKIWEEYQLYWSDELPPDRGWDLRAMVDVHTRTLQQKKFLRDVRESGARYLVLRASSWDAKRQQLRAARAHLERVHVIPAVAGDEDTELKFYNGFQDYHMRDRVLDGVAWGPRIEVFAIR